MNYSVVLQLLKESLSNFDSKLSIIQYLVLIFVFKLLIVLFRNRFNFKLLQVFLLKIFFVTKIFFNVIFFIKQVLQFYDCKVFNLIETFKFVGFASNLMFLFYH